MTDISNKGGIMQKVVNTVHEPFLVLEYNGRINMPVLIEFEKILKVEQNQNIPIAAQISSRCILFM